MGWVRYVGFADVREVGKADLTKLGAEDGKKHTFRRFEPVEVGADTLDVLLTHSAFDGEFEEVDDPDEARQVAAERNVRPMSEQDVVGNEVSSGTSNSSGGPTRGRGSTSGAGSSTSAGGTGGNGPST